MHLHHVVSMGSAAKACVLFTLLHCHNTGTECSHSWVPITLVFRHIGQYNITGKFLSCSFTWRHFPFINVDTKENAPPPPPPPPPTHPPHFRVIKYDMYCQRFIINTAAFWENCRKVAKKPCSTPPSPSRCCVCE